MNWSSLVHEQNIPVAAKPGISGPFPTRKGDETVILGEFLRQFVQVLPELGCDLKVIALMDTDVEKSPVAGKFIKFSC